jgi:hypothetical protein
MPPPKASPPTYELKVTLIGITPPIWRRIQVPSSIKLCCLHSALQAAMGWTDSHLHQFKKDGKKWGIPEYEDVIDESKTQLARVLKSEGESMIYVYDFGDNWCHEVVLEKIISVNVILKTPICLEGARRCPPEDVGGVSGFEKFLKAAFDPSHEHFEMLIRWGHASAEACDVKAVNETLSGMRLPVRHKR